MANILREGQSSLTFHRCLVGSMQVESQLSHRNVEKRIVFVHWWAYHLSSSFADDDSDSRVISRPTAREKPGQG